MVWLVFSSSPTIATPTFTTSATSPLLIGGTGTTSTLTLRSTSGTGTTDADIVFQTGTNGGTEAMRILNGGNVGIGTNNPAQLLHLSGASGLNGATPISMQLTSTNDGTWTDESILSQILFTSSDATGTAGTRGAIKLYADDTTGADNGLSFFTTTNGATGIAERMRITHDGNMGIGTTNPAYNLHVNATDAAGSRAIFTDTDTGVTSSDGTIFGIDSSENANVWNRENTHILFGANNAEVMRIENDGDVGIGTTAPGTRLDVSVGSSGNVQDDGITLTRGTGYIRMTSRTTSSTDFLPAIIGKPIGAVSSGFLFRGLRHASMADTDPSFRLQAGNAANNGRINDDQMAIMLSNWADTPGLAMLGSGFIGIGNESPQVRLHVGSTAITDGTNLLRLEDANSTCNFTADTGSPSCGSDATLKKDIESLDTTSLLTKVSALRPVSYQWKTDGSGAPTQYGFIAQEVAEQFPELVTENTWIDGTKRKFLNMGGLMPYVVGAVKEMEARLTLLEERVNSVFDTLFARVIETQELCVSDGTGAKTCISKETLDALLSQSQIQSGQQEQTEEIVPEESSTEGVQEENNLEGSLTSSQEEIISTEESIVAEEEIVVAEELETQGQEEQTEVDLNDTGENFDESQSAI